MDEGGKVCEQDVVQPVLVVLVLSKTTLECPNVEIQKRVGLKHDVIALTQ